MDTTKKKIKLDTDGKTAKMDTAKKKIKLDRDGKKAKVDTSRKKRGLDASGNKAKLDTSLLHGPDFVRSCLNLKSQALSNPSLGLGQKNHFKTTGNLKSGTSMFLHLWG